MDKDLEYIIEDCKKGKTNAQAAIYNIFAGKMFALCLRYSKNRQEAEDNLHDGFIKIFKVIKDYKYKGSFEGWIRKIFITICLKKYKKNLKLYPIEEIDIPENGWIDNDTLISLPQEKLFELINDLPYKYRLVFNLHVLDSYPHEEIGNILSISTGTSKSNLSRAKKLLRDKITQLIKES